MDGWHHICFSGVESVSFPLDQTRWSSELWIHMLCGSLSLGTLQVPHTVKVGPFCRRATLGGRWSPMDQRWRFLLWSSPWTVYKEGATLTNLNHFVIQCELSLWELIHGSLGDSESPSVCVLVAGEEGQGGWLWAPRLQAPMRRYLPYTFWKFKLTDFPSEIILIVTKLGKCLSRFHWCSHVEGLIQRK